MYRYEATTETENGLDYAIWKGKQIVAWAYTEATAKAVIDALTKTEESK